MSKTTTDPPANAFRAPGFFTLTHLDGHDGRKLNLRNIIFIEGGSLVWYEAPATVCVLHVFPCGREPKDWDGKVRRYEGVWEDPS